MNVDSPQANCDQCDRVPQELELTEPEPVFYGDDDIVMTLLVILWCETCRQHIIYFDAD